MRGIVKKTVVALPCLLSLTVMTKIHVLEFLYSCFIYEYSCILSFQFSSSTMLSSLLHYFFALKAIAMYNHQPIVFHGISCFSWFSPQTPFLLVELLPSGLSIIH